MTLDIGGADGEVVSYRITFVKPGFEITLLSEQVEVVVYQTNEASFAASAGVEAS